MAKHAKPKRATADEEFGAMVARMIVALGRRAGSNPQTLALMPSLQQLLRDEYRAAGRELYESGMSLVELARYMSEAGHKMTKQAAQQQFSPAGQSYVRTRGQATEIVRKQAEIAAKAANVIWPQKWHATSAGPVNSKKAV